MAHSFRAHYFHVVWATKNRENLICYDIKQKLYAYINGIIKKYNGDLLSIGGMPDHIHLLIKLSSLEKFSEIIKNIKIHSSLWLKKTFKNYEHFSWQEGYGSFSVSHYAVDRVKNYILNQEEHHKRKSFHQEYVNFLKRHKMKHDPQSIFK